LTRFRIVILHLLVDDLRRVALVDFGLFTTHLSARVPGADSASNGIGHRPFGLAIPAVHAGVLPFAVTVWVIGPDFHETGCAAERARRGLSGANVRKPPDGRPCKLQRSHD
jgi:hypothetical protein